MAISRVYMRYYTGNAFKHVNVNNFSYVLLVLQRRPLNLAKKTVRYDFIISITSNFGCR